MTAISTNELIISYQVRLLIFGIVFIPPMLFINYKLFKIARKSRRNNGISPEMKKSFSFKNVSSCLLIVACLMAVYIPTFIYIGRRLNSNETEYTLHNTEITEL